MPERSLRGVANRDLNEITLENEPVINRGGAFSRPQHLFTLPQMKNAVQSQLNGICPHGPFFVKGGASCSLTWHGFHFLWHPTNCRWIHKPANRLVYLLGKHQKSRSIHWQTVTHYLANRQIRNNLRLVITETTFVASIA